MEWLKNNHPAVIISAMYCLGFGLFFYASLSTYISYDAFWHLKMGQDLLGSGLSPTVDHYSYTYEGKPIVGLPYMFQVVLAGFVSVFGNPAGFQLLKIFSFGLFLLAIRVFYREIRAPWQIIVITLPYIFLFLLYRFNNIRPEIFDSSLVVVALVLYLRASVSFSNKNLAAIVLLQLIWVNYHAPILGYVIFFGLFLDKAIIILRRADSSVTWQRWAGWGAVLFITGFANPEFRHPVFSMLAVSGEWGQITSELKRATDVVPNSSLFTLFWLVSAYLVIALTVQRQIGLALLCGIFAFQFWASVNLISLAGVVVFLLLAFSLSEMGFVKLLERVKPGIVNMLRILAVVMAVSGITLTVSKAGKVYQESNSDELPHDVVSYLKETYPDGGRIFNRLRDGGYLAYHLSPEFKIYIDGRTNVLYPIDFARRYARLYSAQDADSIASEVNRYEIDFAMFPLDLGWFQVADNLNPLSVEYISKDYILMTGGKDNFPLGSRIMYFPMCWRFGYQPGLVGEFHMARQILPADSTLTPILGSLVELSQSTGPTQLFAGIEPQSLTSDYHKRLLAYIALEADAPGQALYYFATIDEKSSLDVLMMAYAALNDQNYEQAEKIVLGSLSDSWATLNDLPLSVNEQAIAASLLEKLKLIHPLSTEGEHYRVLLTQDLGRKLPDLKLPLENVVPQGNCDNLFSVPLAAAN